MAVWQPCELLYTCYLLTFLAEYAHRQRERQKTVTEQLNVISTLVADKPPLELQQRAHTVCRWDVLDSIADERRFIQSECEHDCSQILAVSDRLANTVRRHRHVQVKRVKRHALVQRVDQQSLGRRRRK